MSTEQIDKFQTTVQIPEGVTVNLKKYMLEVNGPLGKTFKSFRKIPVNIKVKDGLVELKATGQRKRDFAIMNTSRSIIRNLIEGVVEGYTIKMKIVFAHFPVTIKAKDDKVIIENFQGERSARISRIIGKTKVVPKGEDVLVTGHVKADVTQTAANIELKTRVKGKDHRVFLDGVYIFEESKGIEK